MPACRSPTPGRLAGPAFRCHFLLKVVQLDIATPDGMLAAVMKLWLTLVPSRFAFPIVSPPKLAQ